jgi:predicted ATP-dependent endonuclease of OLD family
MLREQLTPEQRAQVSVAYRTVKEEMTRTHLVDANKAMSELSATLDGEQLSLAMDQSSRSSWDLSVIPHVSELPFSMAGLGQQVAIKIALAMGRSTDRARVVTIEEPENHLSHTSLNRLVSRIQKLRGDRQQIFISTHSSYVLNRLGLDALRLLSDGSICTFDEISNDTVSYFQRLPGYDTLRLVLADRFALVEGPSDEIVFERFYHDKYNKRPIEDGVDVLSMRGLSPVRFLEIAQLLNKRGVIMRDNDGKDLDGIREPLATYLDDTRRKLFVGEGSRGNTLEPQIISVNDADTIRSVLGRTERADLKTWMSNNKTEAAIRIASSDTMLTTPIYMAEAVEFVHDVQ